MSIFDKEKNKRVGNKKEKRNEILRMMRELEQMICTIGNDAINNQMQLYHEHTLDNNSPNTSPDRKAKQKQEEREKMILE